MAAKMKKIPNLQTIISAKGKRFKRVMFRYFKRSQCLSSLTFYKSRMAPKMAAK